MATTTTTRTMVGSGSGSIPGPDFRGGVGIGIGINRRGDWNEGMLSRSMDRGGSGGGIGVRWMGLGLQLRAFVGLRRFRTSAVVLQKKGGEGDKLGKKAVLPLLPKTTHENIWNLPNILTFSRLLAAPLIGYLVLHSHHTAALTLLITAGLTDLLDGYLARRYNLQTVIGTVIDPMADKTLMTILTVTLTMKSLLPIWLAVIILGRDIALAISAIYYRYISLPPPKTFMRYWDFSLPSAEVKPTAISKVNTVLQLALITVSTAYPVLPVGEVVLRGMWYLVATTTVWSGLSYLGNKNAVVILSQQKGREEKGEAEKAKGGKAE